MLRDVNALELRLERQDAWYTEFAQWIYEVYGELKPYIQEGHIYKGRKLEVDSEDPRRPENSVSKVFIHNHPSENPLIVPNDLRPMLERTPFIGHRTRHEDALITIVSTDTGYFMTFPSKETGEIVLNETQSELLGKQNDESPTNSNQSLWDDLQNRYSLKQYESEGFSGLPVGVDSYPMDVNRRGAALINLEHLLRKTRYYKIPLYFCSKEDDIFKRLNGVEDYFHDLEERKV